MHRFRECRKYLVYVRNFDSDTVPFRDLLVCQHNWVYRYSPHFSSIVTRYAVSCQGEIVVSSCRRIPCFRILNRFLKGYYSIFSIFSFRFSTSCGLPVRKWFLNTTSYVLGKCEKHATYLCLKTGGKMLADIVNSYCCIQEYLRVHCVFKEKNYPCVNTDDYLNMHFQI